MRQRDTTSGQYFRDRAETIPHIGIRVIVYVCAISQQHERAGPIVQVAHHHAVPGLPAAVQALPQGGSLEYYHLFESRTAPWAAADAGLPYQPQGHIPVWPSSTQYQ